MRRSTTLAAALLFTAVALLSIAVDAPKDIDKGTEPPAMQNAEREDAEAPEPPTEAAQIIPAVPEEMPEPEGELLSPSGLTAAELEAGLLGELKQYAEAFIAAERETGVNANFLTAVAALESGWNTSEVAQNKNNLFGWSAATGYAAFESKEDCIAKVAAYIKSLYLTPDGAYFNGYTVEAVNIRYNGNEHWENTVSQIIQEIQERIERSAENAE